MTAAQRYAESEADHFEMAGRYSGGSGLPHLGRAVQVGSRNKSGSQIVLGLEYWRIKWKGKAPRNKDFPASGKPSFPSVIVPCLSGTICEICEVNSMADALTS